MKISILGTGMVGQSVANKMNALGHKVTMGTRNPEETMKNKKANATTGVIFSDWHKENLYVKLERFSDVARNADLIINATSGMATLQALNLVGKNNLDGKILIDIANPLDFSQGMPPSLNPVNTDSLGEQIQKTFPETKVVKTLNTMSTFIMMNPEIVPGDHSVFVSGNNIDAKREAIRLLESIGWQTKNIIDLGDISTARGTEMMLPIWLRLYNALGHANFNFHIQQ